VGDVPGASPAGASRPLSLHVTASLDPLAVAAGRAIPAGRWVAEARLMAVGLDRKLPVQVPDDDGAWSAVRPGLVGHEPIGMRPAATTRGAAAIDITHGPSAVASIVAGAGAELEPTDGRRLDVVLRVATTPGTVAPAVLVVQLPGTVVRFPARLVPGPDGARLQAELALGEGAAGPASLGIAATPDGPPIIDLGRLEIGSDGRAWATGARRVSGPERRLRDLALRVRLAQWRLAVAGQRVFLTARLTRAALRHMRHARGRSWRAMLLSAPRIRPWR
jgi:hypothetical protein